MVNILHLMLNNI